MTDQGSTRETVSLTRRAVARAPVALWFGRPDVPEVTVVVDAPPWPLVEAPGVLTPVRVAAPG